MVLYIILTIVSSSCVQLLTFAVTSTASRVKNQPDKKIAIFRQNSDR